MTPRCHCTIETIVFSSAGWPKRPTVYVRPSNTSVECCRLSPRRRERPQHDKDGYLAVPGQAIKCGRRPMTREEIEHKMDELARGVKPYRPLGNEGRIQARPLAVYQSIYTLQVHARKTKTSQSEKLFRVDPLAQRNG